MVEAVEGGEEAGEEEWAIVEVKVVSQATDMGTPGRAAVAKEAERDTAVVACEAKADAEVILAGTEVAVDSATQQAAGSQW